MKQQYSAFPDTRAFIKHSLRYVHGAALDLGAGRAKYKDIIREKCSSYTALDLFPGPGIDIVSDVHRTPCEDASFDTVYCTQVLEHVPRPWVVAQEIRRILKPNGVCVVTAPFLQASHADPDDYFRYTIAGLESLFGEPDFEILESGSQGRLYSILVDFIRMVSFNVYEKPKPYTWRLVRMLISLGSILDRMCSNKIIYMNSYVIARKK
jgi:SAM-dependent methyltransferase